MAGPRLTRDLQHSMIGGVCSGIALRYGFDVTLVRVVTVLLAVATSGVALPVYIAAWIVMPRADAEVPVPRPFADTPDSLSRELREVSDRLTEAARVLADKTREAAEEISEIARRARTEGTSTPGDAAHANNASVTQAVEDRANDMSTDAPAAETGGDVDESLSSGRPPVPHPGTSPAGSVPPTPPAP